MIIQAEKVNGNCHYVLEGGAWQDGLWICEDSWWWGGRSKKGQCNGDWHASIDSKSNIRVQDDSLQWKWVDDGTDVDLKFNCVYLCL